MFRVGQRSAEGEQFTSLLAAHIGIVRKISTIYCRNADDRSDLVQDIIVRLWDAWPRYDPARPFSTWMYRVSLNVAISHVRHAYRQKRHFVPFDIDQHETADLDVDHEANQQSAALQTAIAELDPMNRALLLLYLDERSHHEIGEILGISESNVGTKIARVAHRLRTRFSEMSEGSIDATK